MSTPSSQALPAPGSETAAASAVVIPELPVHVAPIRLISESYFVDYPGKVDEKQLKDYFAADYPRGGSAIGSQHVSEFPGFAESKGRDPYFALDVLFNYLKDKGCASEFEWVMRFCQACMIVKEDGALTDFFAQLGFEYQSKQNSPEEQKRAEQKLINNIEVVTIEDKPVVEFTSMVDYKVVVFLPEERRGEKGDPYETLFEIQLKTTFIHSYNLFKGMPVICYLTEMTIIPQRPLTEDEVGKLEKIKAFLDTTYGYRPVVESPNVPTVSVQEEAKASAAAEVPPKLADYFAEVLEAKDEVARKAAATQFLLKFEKEVPQVDAESVWLFLLTESKISFETAQELQRLFSQVDADFPNVTKEDDLVVTNVNTVCLNRLQLILKQYQAFNTRSFLTPKLFDTWFNFYDGSVGESWFFDQLQAMLKEYYLQIDKGPSEERFNQAQALYKLVNYCCNENADVKDEPATLNFFRRLQSGLRKELFYLVEAAKPEPDLRRFPERTSAVSEKLEQEPKQPHWFIRGLNAIGRGIMYVLTLGGSARRREEEKNYATSGKTDDGTEGFALPPAAYPVAEQAVPKARNQGDIVRALGGRAEAPAMLAKPEGGDDEERSAVSSPADTVVHEDVAAPMAGDGQRDPAAERKLVRPGPGVMVGGQ